METTSEGTSLPKQGIKRKILELLAVLGDQGSGELLRRVLQYRGRNWRYFMGDLVDRGILVRSATEDDRLFYSFAEEGHRSEVLESLGESDRDRITAVLSGPVAESADEGGVGRDGSEEDVPGDESSGAAARLSFPLSEGPQGATETPDEPAAEEGAEKEGGVELPDVEVVGAAEVSGDGETTLNAKRKPTKKGRGGAKKAEADEVSESKRKPRGGRRERRRSRSGKETGEELLQLLDESIRRGDYEFVQSLTADGLEGRYADAPKKGGRPLDAEFRLRHAFAQFRSMHLKEARQSLDELASGDGQGDHVRPLADLLRGEIALVGGRVDEAAAFLESARKSAATSDAISLRASLLEAALLVERSEASRALAFIRDCRETMDDPTDRARMALLRGRALMELRDYEGSIAPLQEALDIYRNRDHSEGERDSSLFLGLAFHLRAQFAKSDSFLDRAESLVKERGHAAAKVQVCLVRAEIFSERGDVERMDSVLASIRGASVEKTPGFVLQDARLLALKGRHAAAIKALLPLGEKGVPPRIAVAALRETGVWYRAMGKPAEGVKPLRQAMERAESIVDKESVALGGVELALAYLDQDDQHDHVSAVVAVKKAVRLLEFLERPDLIWRGYHALGRIYLAEKRAADAFSQLGDACGILDRLLGRFQERRDRESFLERRFEPYRDRVVAYLSARPYDVSLARLKTCTYAELMAFLRKNAELDADSGPRYNEIGRLSAALFEQYESRPPATIEDVESVREVEGILRTITSVLMQPDAGAVAGELLSEAMGLIAARMGAVGLVDSGREDRLDYFKGRNLPARAKSQDDPIRGLIREISRVPAEVSLDSRDRLDGPGDPRALAFPLPGTTRFSGAMVLWFKRGNTPTNQELDKLRALVGTVAPLMTREFRLREAKMEAHRAKQEVRAVEAERDDAEREVRELEDNRRSQPEAPTRDSESKGDRTEVVLEGRESLKVFLEKTEHDLLGRALERFEGDVPEMARALGFTAANLKKKLARFGLLES